MNENNAVTVSAPDAICDEGLENSGRPDYETLDQLTSDASVRVLRLKVLAAESRDLWEQVGQDIADMRRLAPRHAVIRHKWLTAVGLGIYTRPAQVSNIVKWGAERATIEQALALPPFAATAQSIMAAYWKVAKKTPVETTDDEDNYTVPESPYHPSDLEFVHGKDLDKAVGALMQDARKHGADEVSAAQFALAYAQAQVHKAQDAVDMAARHKEAQSRPDDPDADF